MSDKYAYGAPMVDGRPCPLAASTMNAGKHNMIGEDYDRNVQNLLSDIREEVPPDGVIPEDIAQKAWFWMPYMQEEYKDTDEYAVAHAVAKELGWE